MLLLLTSSGNNGTEITGHGTGRGLFGELTDSHLHALSVPYIFLLCLCAVCIPYGLCIPGMLSVLFVRGPVLWFIYYVRLSSFMSGYDRANDECDMAVYMFMLQNEVQHCPHKHIIRQGICMAHMGHPRHAYGIQGIRQAYMTCRVHKACTGHPRNGDENATSG